MSKLLLKAEGARCIVVTRRFNAPPEAVYRAHTEPALVQKWMLGPEGWTMPVCQIDRRAGGKIRYEWSNDTGRAFYLTGEIVELTPFSRIVHIERMHMPDPTPDNHVVTTFDADGTGTLMTMRMTLPNPETRAAMLATGMAHGMEASYARLERTSGWEGALECTAGKIGEDSRASVHFSIDVPDLAAGLRFYGAVFGFVETARPFPTMAVLDANNATVCMHEKAAGSRSSSGGAEVRRYERHWTPVHLDLHVHDLDVVLAKVRAEGGAIESEFRTQGPMPVAFCSDPFGNGFCVIGEPTR